MFLDPGKLNQAAPAEVLEAAARGHLGIDQRFLHSLIDRPAESLPAILAFPSQSRSHDREDIFPDLIAVLRHWNAPESIPFLIDFLKHVPDEVPDDAVFLLVNHAAQALDPLLALYSELDETDSGEVAFLLANLGVRDPRVLAILDERLAYDLSDTLLLLDMYHDPAAIPAIEKAAAVLEDRDTELKEEVAKTIESLKHAAVQTRSEPEPFDIWDRYPEEEDLPIDLLDDDERLELLKYPSPSVRAAAARSFFNQPLTPEQTERLLHLAQHDESPNVRGRAWEGLIDATEDVDVVNAMLAALRKTDLPVEERGGLLVALAPEADRNEVRQAIEEFYKAPAGRAKALEAMWRSMHSSFREYFAPHLEDEDLEIRRSALWGVGYFGLKSELQKVRGLFDDEELRADALFAYALAFPTEVSRGRMKGVLERIQKDAKGLADYEEELVKAALDERLMLAGKEPFFREQED